MSSTRHDQALSAKHGEKQPDEQKAPGNAWGDRVRALKNVPSVLHFVWESGPGVVFWNITIRIVVAFLPVAIGVVARSIINGVIQARTHGSLPQNFWLLVGAE